MKKVISLLLAVMLCAVFVVFCPVHAAGADSSETFYQDISTLLEQQDDSYYFNEMELEIGSTNLTIDGEIYKLDVVPEIVNNRTMLPIRAVAEATGATVDWVQDTATVVIESAYGDEISCSIGSETITVNEVESNMDVTPYVKDGRTYLPLRAVSEALALEVDWSAADSTITLTSPFQCARILVLGDSPDLSNLYPKTTITDGNGLWVLQFATPTEAREAVELLVARGITAEPDYYIPPIEDEIDTSQPTLGASSYSWGVTDCGFDKFTSSYSNLLSDTGIVAVVDTGVDLTHPFLSGRLLTGYDVIDGDNSPNDKHGHGTHVSGIIIDCVGNAPVNILPIRVLGDNGSGTSLTVAAGVRYAATHNADVINLSLGGGHSDAIDSAIEYAVSEGVAVVIAAGNDNADTLVHCPAHITTPGTIVVSSGDSGHRKANSSNYGSNIDLMAPGVNIRASIPNGTYGYKSGTSMATPHASAATILLDLAWGKSLKPDALEEKVHSATTNGSWNNQYVGYGFLDMRNAELPLITYQIYFDSNGGSSTVSSKKVTQNKEYGDLPVPTRRGYLFDGWYTALSGGVKVVSSTIVNLTADQTLYAHWRDNSTTLTFDSLSVPNGLVEGNDGHVDGEIRSSNSPITLVKAEVYKLATQEKVMTATSSGFSVSIYGPIKNSKIDTDLKLSLLSAGTYYVKYTATAKDGTSGVGETSTFQVLTQQKKVTEIEFHSLTVPDNMPTGSNGHIDGSITTTNGHIVSVRAETIDASSGEVRFTAISSGFSLTKYGPLKNSKIDADLKFSKLPAGTYYVKYMVSAQDGTTRTAETSAFKVVAPETNRTEITFHSLTSPGTITEGSPGHIDGSIVSLSSPIVSVKAETINASTGSVVLSAFSSGFSITTYGPIKNSKVDADSKFSSLPPGTYFVRITATTQDGTVKSAETTTFQVVAHQREETRIEFHSLSTPGDLIVGYGGHIDGSITTTGSPIISVKAEVYDNSSGNKVMEAYSGGFSLSSYGPIKNSKIDADLKFGSLPVGTYYIKYTATTYNGAYKSANTGTFRVLAPAAITEISFHSLTTPGNLAAGSGGHIDGTITSSGSPIILVKAEVINASTGAILLTAQSSGFALSTYGPIKNSKIDMDLRFGSLTSGTYFLRYTVRSADGTEGTGNTSNFSIK